MNMERKKEPKPREFLFPGILLRPDDSWCVHCNKSTYWTGPVWSVSLDEISLWGTIEGCHECDKWTWRNSKGLITQVDVYKTEKGR